MNIMLTPIETRILGSLIEKEMTTPEYYPLTLNSLRLACNQKSNREPVMELDETTVEQTLDGLREKRFVTRVSISGARVAKYRHNLPDVLKFTPQEMSLIGLLFLRGPQTVGELRTRSNRMYDFTDLMEVESTLQHLIDREDGPFVVRLPREPGQREQRYAHLFSGEVKIETTTKPGISMNKTEATRLDQIEQQLNELKLAYEDLKQQFEQFKKQFE